MAGFAAVVAAAPVLPHGIGVDVVHAQAWHDFGVELDLEAPPGAGDDDVGHDHVAFDIDEAASGLGLQPGDQRQGGAHGGVVQATQVAQALDVALGHELQRLAADGQRGPRLGAVAQFQDLQAQAFAQITRAHARRLHVLQQLQRHAQALFERFALFQLVLRIERRPQRRREPQPGAGQVGQAFFEVTVVVERLDQEIQRGAVLVAQAQAAGLVVQVVLQADGHAREVGGAGGLVVVARGAVVARRRVAAPLTVVGCHLDRAVAFPALFHRRGAIEPALQRLAVSPLAAVRR